MDENTKELLKDNLTQYVEDITSKSKGGNYICPLCGSGTGKNRSGAFSIKPDGNTWHCFSCGRGGDIFDLIGEYEHIEDKGEQFNRAMDLFGLKPIGSGTKKEKARAPRNKATVATDQKEPAKKEIDYTKFFKEAHAGLKDTDYLTNRGISKETQEKYNIGFIKEWESWDSVAGRMTASPRLIIPTSKYSYAARDTRPGITEGKVKKKGNVHIFNEGVLKDAEEPIYIVEGEIDALSLIEIGANVIAMGGVSNQRQTIESIKRSGTDQPFIIALDNDDAGEKAAAELAELLDKNDIKYIKYNVAGEYKDANEILQENKVEFLSLAIEGVEYAKRGVTKEEIEDYLKNATSNYIQSFMDDIATNANTPFIPTGFKTLDNALDGGLFEGLYFLGAISSLGKSTFILQIADQIAKEGHDVLIFALEMSRYELMAKSISRNTCDLAIEKGISMNNAKTNRGITTYSRYEKYSATEKNLIQEAVNKYAEYSKHVYISAKLGAISVNDVIKTVDKHVAVTGNKPVVIVDYLQILKPYNVKYTDKQNTDTAVLLLKQLSNKHHIPVLGISSFNRDNYKEAVSMKAFKESGAIEYGSDVLIGLQFEGAGKKGFDEIKAKTQNPRQVELKILKNRNGATGATIKYNYYALFSKFSEVGLVKDEF